MTDKDIYNVAANINSNVGDLSAAFITASNLMKARQSSINDNLVGNNIIYRNGLNGMRPHQNGIIKSIGNKIRGKQFSSIPAKLISKLAGSKTVSSLIGRAAAGVAGSSAAAGVAGTSAAASSIAAMAALIGPVSVALALGPVLKGIAEE